MQKSYALVTGVSSGIDYEIAEILQITLCSLEKTPQKAITFPLRKE